MCSILKVYTHDHRELQTTTSLLLNSLCIKLLLIATNPFNLICIELDLDSPLSNIT